MPVPLLICVLNFSLRLGGVGLEEPQRVCHFRVIPRFYMGVALTPPHAHRNPSDLSLVVL